MQIVRKVITIVIAALMVAPGSASADGRHVVDPTAMAATIARHAEQQDADRAAVREALAQPQVLQMAARMGLDINRAGAALDTLAGSDLTRAASAARQVNQRLVGGASTVVISTTTIIIALLVVILLVVAVK